MTTSDGSWLGKLRKITDLERGDHHHLTADDDCYFVGEYTSGAGFSHSSTNQLVLNLKKKPSTRGTYQWKYKGQAILKAAAALANGINMNALNAVAFVPIPPSKLPNDPEYDDRMSQVVRAIHRDVDLRELIYLAAPRAAAHQNDTARDPVALQAQLSLRTEHFANLPQIVFLVDDMLTTGCSFRACKDMILSKLPNTKVIGLFVARRIIDHSWAFGDLTDLEDL
ncbi:phosphoribosyltransferase [Sphingobium sp. B2]|uniref:phosphoribosyltransferase n=1 Tax=Sphingobium sp. B2 TaxID=2583228 RepID=UPI0011A13A11|nr:phosphoribosyltransferase [Sphingobium sp. B2]